MGSHAEHVRSAAGRRRTAVRVVGRDTGDDELDDELLATYRRRYGDLVEAGWAANPEHGPGQRGQRRRPRLKCLADRSVRPGVASLDAAVIGGAEVADSLGHVVRHSATAPDLAAWRTGFPLWPGGTVSLLQIRDRRSDTSCLDPYSVKHSLDGRDVRDPADLAGEGNSPHEFRKSRRNQLPRPRGPRRRAG